MSIGSRQVLVWCSLLFAVEGFAQIVASDVDVPLIVPAGTPLRLQVGSTTFPRHVGEVVHARLAQPIFAFDREVLPAGTEATGRIISFSKASRWQRVERMLSGHFGSFKKPEVQFDTLLTLGGAPRRIVTDTTPGNGQTVEMRAESKPKRGVVSSAVARGKQEINNRWNATKRFLRSDRKTQIVRDAALDLLPYRRARITRGSYFDAVLMTQQAFGSERVPTATVLQLGQITPEEGTSTANLVTELHSAKTKAGFPVEASLSAPLFGRGHTLVLPQGTRLLGTVSTARPARNFHRNGQLRFSFRQVELPAEIVALQQRLSAQPFGQPEMKIRAGITGLTTRRDSHISVDDEGVPKIEESKTRFIAPAISVALVAAANSQELENGTVQNSAGAQSVAGAAGLGLAGLVVGRYSHEGALVLGSLGAARSVYSQFLGKGYEIQIPRNTLLLIQFGRTGNTVPKSSMTTN